ncbi:MAG: MBL fold metallo-hydrolase [Microscillaceae bacterium]|jgi:alkyl sulfatase BDS1-like metallo-beta-lactamase superfamily hydrolase|nr:MBL fold metallo-hydrolase [Microscillaceae bacterium]
MKNYSYFCLLWVLTLSLNACTDEQPATQRTIEVKSTSNTQAIHRQVINYLDFKDSTDFINARRGFIATLQDPIIRNSDGTVAYNLNEFDFLQAPAAVSANPSLWRQSQLNRIHGLFEVLKDKIYQIRGFDLANMTFIASENGWIVIDPLTSEASSRAGLDLVNSKLGKKPIKAIIFTHSHIDHFGGVKGIVSEEQAKQDKVEIIAPEGFFEHAISENVIAGNAMLRRAMFMFGQLLERSPKGLIGNGLAQVAARGKTGILKPTQTIKQNIQKMTVDGIEMIFQNTPGAEAPAECMFYFPQWKAFCQAEEINHTLHNLLTPRGAQVRDGLKWAKYIDQTIQLFGKAVEVSFGSHHWPTWENQKILKLWQNQRDLYKFIHDETLYLANQGFTMSEIAEMIQLPDALAKAFANRDYYGTLRHNAKAQYQLYYGWFDANPAHLNPLPPTEESKKYVEYMGGTENILAKAQKDFDKGEFRWVAKALNHVVFAEPQNQKARELLAKTYTELAYQAESGVWRNFYLVGAFELRNGTKNEIYQKNQIIPNPDILTNLSLETFYDYIAVRLDRRQAVGKKYVFNLVFPDIKQQISLYLENQVLHNRPGVLAENATATITMNKTTFDDIITQKSSGTQKYLFGEIKIEGNRDAYADFQKMISKPFDNLFNIIEP